MTLIVVLLLTSSLCLEPIPWITQWCFCQVIVWYKRAFKVCRPDWVMHILYTDSQFPSTFFSKWSGMCSA